MHTYDIGEEGTCSVVYGPNGSGKSIYLRCLGDIVYLAQIGCFVPAEEARMRVFHKIYTKFTTFEDTTLNKSLFY